jgi:hypothetical protein
MAGLGARCYDPTYLSLGNQSVNQLDARMKSQVASDHKFPSSSKPLNESIKALPLVPQRFLNKHVRTSFGGDLGDRDVEMRGRRYQHDIRMACHRFFKFWIYLDPPL